MFNIYDVRENKRTVNFGGYEIIVDGENGVENYPGKWDLSECKRHYMQGVPWHEPLKDIHTCIIKLDGMFYAIGHDLFMTTIYAIGPDRQPGKENTVYFCHGDSPDRSGRNNAVRSVCIPHDYKTAVNIARSHGIYDGQLYSLETEE